MSHPEWGGLNLGRSASNELKPYGAMLFSTSSSCYRAVMPLLYTELVSVEVTVTVTVPPEARHALSNSTICITNQTFITCPFLLLPFGQ